MPDSCSAFPSQLQRACPGLETGPTLECGSPVPLCFFVSLFLCVSYSLALLILIRREVQKPQCKITGRGRMLTAIEVRVTSPPCCRIQAHVQRATHDRRGGRADARIRRRLELKSNVKKAAPTVSFNEKQLATHQCDELRQFSSRADWIRTSDLCTPS